MEQLKKIWGPLAAIIGAFLLVWNLIETFQGDRTLFTALLILFALVILFFGVWELAFAESTVPGWPKYPFHWVAKAILVATLICLIVAVYYVWSILSVSQEEPALTATITNTPVLTSTPSLTATFTSSPTSTFTPTSTSTFTPTPTSTFTPTATFTSTINPVEFRGINKNCIDPSYWTPYFLESDLREVYPNNCWNLSRWGIFAQNGGITFEVRDLRQDITRRIYTPIKGNVDIKLTIGIDSFATSKDLRGVLILGVGRPETLLNYGYYLLFVQDSKDNTIFRYTGRGTTQLSDKYAVLEMGVEHNIIFRIKGNKLKILFDGNVIVEDDISDVKEREVFWIGYTLPANNGILNARISNFSIEDTK